jgi:hypothetical protein
MTYKEQLKAVRDLGIDICDLNIADECENIFDFYYTDEEFEKLCEKARDCYIKSDLGALAIALAINHLIRDDEQTIDQVLQMSKWDLIEKASYYV